MRQFVRKASCFMLVLLLVLVAVTPPAVAEGELTLYTPYLELSAAPGESINYSLELINNSTQVVRAALSAKPAGDGWEYDLTAGGRAVSLLAVKPGQSQTATLVVNVPLEIAKGVYTFEVKAGGQTLPLRINVTEQGTYRTDLAVKQANMEGYADTTFTYSATLSNRTAQKQTYALTAEGEAGWDVRIKVDGNSVTAVDVEPGEEKTLSIEAKAPESVTAGTYAIRIGATGDGGSTTADIEAVVRGNYALSLSTSDGVLSTDIQAGGKRTMSLTVTNTGSVALEDITLSAPSKPSGWEVAFDPSSIRNLQPGETATAQVTMTADKSALPGDYAISLKAASTQKSSSADIRVSVKSSLAWGWAGLLIILAVCAGIYWLFRKYGRR